jgi:hypothetical protein
VKTTDNENKTPNTCKTYKVYETTRGKQHTTIKKSETTGPNASPKTKYNEQMYKGGRTSSFTVKPSNQER